MTGRPLVLSLFPGLGLLDRAFELEGFTVVRGPDVLWGGRIETFHPPAGVFDGVIGGPPCQTFSTLANLVRAKGHEPRFGNLIPEFERCVAEAEPAWFLMENVRAAPLPVVAGYAVADFLLCNSWLDAGDGMGEKQERKRRFSFGVRGAAAPDLRRWIKPAALLLPAASAVLADARETPVKLGGSGKVKRSRLPTVVAGHDDPPGQRRKTSEVLRERSRQGSVTAEPVDNRPERKTRTPAVRAGSNLQPTADYLLTRQPTVLGRIAGDSRATVGSRGVRGERRTLAEMCRLQGLPEDFLADAPFTTDGKRKAIANGVPLPMGRAIAKAIREAIQ